jgi:hypothetical protein
MELAIIWFICAVACAAIASSKNRSAAHFFGGLAFGIIWVIVVCAMPAIQKDDVTDADYYPLPGEK